MRRREFIGLLGAAFAWPLWARAQQPKRIWRIGYLTTGYLNSVAYSQIMFDAFRQGLRDHGYVEGQDIVIEVKAAGGKTERFSALARELVELKIDLIVATNTLAARGAQEATTTIPIVVPVMGDPVGDGLVSSLARPGGNVTGLAFLGPELLPKRLELLKEALPAAFRVAALWQPGAYGDRTMDVMMKGGKSAAAALGLELRLYAAKSAADFDAAFAAIAGERADALIVYPSPMLFTEHGNIADRAAKLRIPLIAMGREFVEAGGLISYGASISGLHRQVAAHVNRILKGVKPADIPIEQATRFELVVNLKAARTLEITLPESLIARADEVIE